MKFSYSQHPGEWQSSWGCACIERKTKDRTDLADAGWREIPERSIPGSATAAGWSCTGDNWTNVKNSEWVGSTHQRRNEKTRYEGEDLCNGETRVGLDFVTIQNWILNQNFNF